MSKSPITCLYCMQKPGCVYQQTYLLLSLFPGGANERNPQIRKSHKTVSYLSKTLEFSILLKVCPLQRNLPIASRTEFAGGKTGSSIGIQANSPLVFRIPAVLVMNIVPLNTPRTANISSMTPITSTIFPTPVARLLSPPTGAYIFWPSLG